MVQRSHMPGWGDGGSRRRAAAGHHTLLAAPNSQSGVGAPLQQAKGAEQPGGGQAGRSSTAARLTVDQHIVVLRSALVGKLLHRLQARGSSSGDNEMTRSQACSRGGNGLWLTGSQCKRGIFRFQPCNATGASSRAVNREAPKRSTSEGRARPTAVSAKSIVCVLHSLAPQPFALSAHCGRGVGSRGRRELMSTPAECQPLPASGTVQSAARMRVASGKPRRLQPHAKKLAKSVKLPPKAA